MGGVQVAERCQANQARRMGPGAVCRKGTPAFVIEDSLGHDRARRVSRAQKQDVVVPWHGYASLNLSEQDLLKRGGAETRRKTGQSPGNDCSVGNAIGQPPTRSFSAPLRLRLSSR